MFRALMEKLKAVIQYLRIFERTIESIESLIGEDSKVPLVQPVPRFLSSQDGLYINRVFLKLK